jgi:hypothetical protein
MEIARFGGQCNALDLRSTKFDVNLKLKACLCKLGLATSTHLANYINNSLTKLTFCGGSSTQSESDSEFDDDDCWRFFDGLMEGQHTAR